MAKVIVDEQAVIVQPWWAKGRIEAVGALLGLSWWILTAILNQYVIEPFACRDLATAAACINSYAVSGSVATVIAAVIGVFALVRAIQPRPIIIAVATAALLWDFAAYMTGLAWYETLLWAILIYALAYWLFSLTAQLRTLVGSIVLAVVIVLVIRILLTL